MKLSLSLKTLAWSWGVLLTTCAAGAVALQVVDVVPPPEAPPVVQAPRQVAVLPPAPLFVSSAAAPTAAAPAVAAPKPEPALAAAEPPKPHPPRQVAAALPVPPIPPRVRETREVRTWRRTVTRAYAYQPQWRQPAEPPYWRGSPYPGQYYAYREPWPREQQPPSYYPWPPGE
jgi:hypothetical protein